MRIPCGVCGVDSWSQAEHGQHTDCRAIDDRRQRAREAAADLTDWPQITATGGIEAIELAVEVATQVKITDDIIKAGERAAGQLFAGPAQRRAVIAAAFGAAGFEVLS